MHKERTDHGWFLDFELISVGLSNLSCKCMYKTLPLRATSSDGDNSYSVYFANYKET